MRPGSSYTATGRVAKQAKKGSSKFATKSDVYRQIALTRETKSVGYTLAAATSIHGGGLDPTQAGVGHPKGAGLTFYNLMADLGVSEGIASNQRIGTSIRPKGLRLKFYFTADTQAGDFSPVQVRVIAFKGKSGSGGLPPLLKVDQQSGSAPTDVKIDGAANTEMLPYNYHNYTILSDRTVRISKLPSEVSPVTTNSLVNSNPGGPDRSYGQCNMDLSKFLPSKLYYPHAAAGPAASTPENWWMSLGIYLIDGEGVAIPIGNAPVKAFAYATMTYTDA